MLKFIFEGLKRIKIDVFNGNERGYLTSSNIVSLYILQWSIHQKPYKVTQIIQSLKHSKIVAIF